MSFLNRPAAAIVGALTAVAIVAMAAPSWAGQANLRGVINIQSQNSTIANSLLETINSTIANSILETVSSGLTKDAGGYTLTQTNDSTIADSILETVVSTIADSILETVATSLVEGVFFAGQPADVSVELTQGEVNSSSPFNNQLSATIIDNVVSVTDTTGLTQVNAASGQANVQVASNSIIDGAVLLGLSAAMTSQVALKEFAHATMCPGCGMQNSNISYIEQMVGVAAAAAETSSETNLGTIDEMTDTLTGISTTMNANIVTAIAIDQDNVNEFSPHDNTITGLDTLTNDVVVDLTAGITQVNAAAGQSNVQNSYNNIVYAVDAFLGPDPF